jgi:hypothetical protein
MPACSRRERFHFKVDLSVLIGGMLHRIPAGHTSAPTLAVAEKMADLIKGDYAKV